MANPDPGSRDTPWLEQSLDRQYVWGLMWIVLLALAFPLYRWREPGLRHRAAEEQGRVYVGLGRALFAQHCLACHGVEGTGTGAAPTLHTREFLGSATDQQIAWLIAGGVPGSLMVGYGLDHGGPLTDQQVQQLVAYFRSWERDAPTAPDWRKGVRVELPVAIEPPRPTAPTTPPDRATMPDPAPVPAPPSEGPGGPALYAKYCQACHGERGVGGPPGLGPPLNRKPALDTLTDARIAEVIARGIPGKLMAGQGRVVGGPLAPEQIRDLVSYLRLLSGSAAH